MAPPMIYGPAISTYVRTVRLVCEEKGSPYELVEVDIMQGGNKTPEHLARHPFGRVPAFEHDGFPLYETSAITRYLDAVLPGAALTPGRPEGAARMQQAIAIVDSYAYGAMISAIVMQRVVMPLVGGAADETVVAAALPTAETLARCLGGADRWAHLAGGRRLSLADLHLARSWRISPGRPRGSSCCRAAPGWLAGGSSSPPARAWRRPSRSSVETV